MSNPLTLSEKNLKRLLRKLDRDTHPTYSFDYIDLRSINVLPQVRKTFDTNSLDILATDMARNGQTNLPNLVLYSEGGTRDHLRLVNHLHGTNLTLRNLRPAFINAGVRFYYILVAGERRIRAFKILATKGCLRCREGLGSEIGCFHKHFERESSLVTVQCKVMSGVSPLKALMIQMSENLYERPDSAEEALVYAPFYKLMRLTEKDYTIAKFARRVDRSPKVMSYLIGFSNLPTTIQRYVLDRVISYGIAKELVWLQRQLEEMVGWDKDRIERQIESWFIRAVEHRWKVPQMRKAVRTFIADEQSDSMSLLKQMESNNMIRLSNGRRFFTQEGRKIFLQDQAYLKKVGRLIADGLISKRDSGMKNSEIRDLFIGLLQSEAALLPKLKDVLDKRHYQTIEGAFAEVSIKIV